MKWTKVLLLGTENRWDHLPDGTIWNSFLQIWSAWNYKYFKVALRLDLDLQRQTEGNPYISSFLDRKQSENQREEPVPGSHFTCACPKDLGQSLEFYGTRLLATFVAKALWNKTRIGGCKSCLSAVKNKTDSIISWLIFPYISLVLKYSKWAFLQQLTNNSATSIVFLGSLWDTFIQSSRIV